MRHRGGMTAWVVTLALHLLVALLLIWQTARSPETRRAVGPAPRVSVQLLSVQAPNVVATSTRSIPREQAPRHRSPQAIVVQPAPAPPASPAPSAPDEARTSISPATTTTPPPLILTLPAPSASAVPRSMVNAALNDPRSNSRLTPSERFAATLGTNTDRIEERMADGMRVRQGTSCVLVYESRAAVLNPFNQSGVPMPKLVKPCP